MSAVRSRILLALTPLLGPGPGSNDSEAAAAARVRALASITVDELEGDLRALTGPGMEGRDSPSLGLDRAAAHLEARFAAAGVAPAPDTGAYRRPFEVRTPRPVPESCALRLSIAGGEELAFELGRDFVPVIQCTGEAEGPLVFAGFGIAAPRERYDDLRGLRLEGAIVLVLEGEPRHEDLLDGPEVTEEASLWRKIARLRKEDVAGVLAVRRPAPDLPEGDAPAEGIGFRHTWATWQGEPTGVPPSRTVPVLEVTPACASALLGEDVLELAEAIDRTGQPHRRTPDGRRVALRGEVRTEKVPVDNVVGWVAGTDPELAGEVVVVGAHYDHVGVDPRGRVGHGADDNASGTAALLEIAEAFALVPPRRSVLLCAFAAEEDGLLGAHALLRDPPVPVASMVAMLNLDMIGRGERDEVAAIGAQKSPALRRVVERAERRSEGIREVDVRGGMELWQRSDHLPFHDRGVPALFFFEGLPISRNGDYHTWRDTPDLVDVEKVARTARIIFDVAWILATDDERPPAARD